MPPDDYQKIKASLRKQHPDWSESRIKTVAAKITNAQRKKAGKPAARFHRKK